MLRRTKYLAYYFKKMDWPKFRKFVKYAKKETGWSSFRLYRDSIACVYKYNIGWIDYFIFRFFEKSSSERDLWVGTGFKYESDLLMNSKSTRHLLENKIHFYEAYDRFVIHATCTLDDLQSDNARAQKVLSNSTGKIVIKDALGQCGWDVEVVKAAEYTRESLIKHMKSKGFNLAEEFIIQHPELARLSDSGVNTIRIISQLNKDDEVEILGARLRISVNCHVDNLASGNIAAAVDLKTGLVSGPGVYSDITKSNVSAHPVSGITLEGFQIPMWEDCLNMVKQAALHRPENRSIGWDVVLTEKGPELLEGNHNWCKILWQLPINQGLKSVLERHLSELPAK
ncbi:MAG: hexapeptide transferase [Bacteroidia bacterium]|nr:MAG: hexapeptide transferase [Bacteroidia bacterium]